MATPVLDCIHRLSLPGEVQCALMDYLWGTAEDWKLKLNITHALPTNAWIRLNDVSQYRSYSNTMESEDCLYCRKCGEKTLFFALSFYTDYCEDCTARVQHITY